MGPPRRVVNFYEAKGVYCAHSLAVGIESCPITTAASYEQQHFDLREIAMRLHSCLIAAACTAFLANAATAAPYPRTDMSSPVDVGASAPNKTVTLTIALKLRDTSAMKSLLTALYTPGSPQFHQFLTQPEFAARFGPSAATIAQVTRHFQADGFRVTRSATAQLQITGSVAAVEAEFGVSEHEYRVAATAHTPAYRFRAPASAAKLSPAIAADVQAVLGLSSRPRMRPNVTSAARSLPASLGMPVTQASAPNTPDAPGLWTVKDFEQYYNVDPLYTHGLSGAGQTIGIVTFASFTPSDAYGYWNSLGLDVSPTRVNQVQVDGGSGPPSDASGSIETTLDVEQSGGIAPGANILVYEAPNTNQGFIDNFAAAVDQNQADTLSVSWGEWEWLDTVPVDDVVDPTTGQTASTFQALNDVLLQAAIEGQTFYCAAGDAGAYDANRFFPLPYSTMALAVDAPAAQQFIAAAGGTTLPGPQVFSLSSGGTYTVNVSHERAWAWDYLEPLCKTLGYPDPVSCGIFSVGGGGGVSSYMPLPFYQQFTRGIVRTPRDQSLVDVSGTPLPPGFNLPVNLPGGFRGRNVPDISVNSDPDTGYVIWYTSDVSGFGVAEFYGGTSFAAPQLNGVTSLYDQGLEHRIGLIDWPLYAIADSPGAYRGDDAPLRDITSGDNWYWHARPGYDQATGVGVPNVANLYQALNEIFGSGAHGDHHH